MKVVEQIKQPVAFEMDLFEQKFQLSMSSKVALLNRITHYIVNRKGKQMRPMFVFLVAKMLNNNQVSERTYRGASVIELIHTASLVHDDVVDDSNRRRGFFSINALWKNKIAVLVGDFLLSKGMLVCIDNNDFDLLKIISIAVREMAQRAFRAALHRDRAHCLQGSESTACQLDAKYRTGVLFDCHGDDALATKLARADRSC